MFTASPMLRTVPLASQVGGHLGVHATEDGSLIIKPALPLELQFYQSALVDSSFLPLRPFIPHCYGTLRLEGKLDTENTNNGNIAISKIEGVPPERRDSLVLENLSYRFLKPNILDIKLGTILYDELATPAKIAHAKEKARRTTSFECGMRFTAFQVYDNNTSQPVKIPKSYGYSLKPFELPEAMSRFFPAAPVSVPEGGGVSSTVSQGIPHHLLLRILIGIRDDIVALRNAFEQVHLRMVGGSILITYEADWERAEEGLNALEAMGRERGESENEGRIEDEGDEEDASDDNDGGDDEEEDDDDDDDDSSDGPGPPFVVKLIDFAHTRIASGQGPDQGVLLGLDTLIRLLSGRIDQVRDAGPSPDVYFLDTLR